MQNTIGTQGQADWGCDSKRCESKRAGQTARRQVPRKTRESDMVESSGVSYLGEQLMAWIS